MLDCCRVLHCLFMWAKLLQVIRHNLYVGIGTRKIDGVNICHKKREKESEHLPEYVHFCPSIPADAKFTKPAYNRTTNSSMLKLSALSLRLFPRCCKEVLLPAESDIDCNGLHPECQRRVVTWPFTEALTYWQIKFETVIVLRITNRSVWFCSVSYPNP